MADDSDSSGDEIFADMVGCGDAAEDDDNGSGDESECASGLGIRDIPIASAFQRILRGPDLSCDGDGDGDGDGPAVDHDAADSARRDMGVLRRWIEEKGGFVHPRLTLAPFPNAGIGGTLAPGADGSSAGGGSAGGGSVGELLIRVPAVCVMFADAASTAGLAAADSEGGEGDAGVDLKQVVLALCLKLELDKGEASEFYPYTATLPKSLASFPVLWGRRELELLSDASAEARQQVAAQADALNREHRLVHAALAAAGNDAKLSFGEYAEAKLLVSSRCFGIGDQGDVALLPMVDMLNHAAKPHVSLGRSTGRSTGAAAGASAVAGGVASGGEEGGSATAASAGTSATGAAAGTAGMAGAAEGFTLTLVRAAKPGEEVCSTYDKGGGRSACSWLLNYGFVPADLPPLAAPPATAAEAAGATGLPHPPPRGSGGGTDGGAADVAAVGRYDKAIEGLVGCGPHTHGAVALLRRERDALLLGTQTASSSK